METGGGYRKSFSFNPNTLSPQKSSSLCDRAADLDRDNAYYLVAPPRAFERRNVQAFRDFLLAELAAETRGRNLAKNEKQARFQGTGN